MPKAALSKTARIVRTLSIGGATQDLFVSLPKESVHVHENRDSIVLPLGDKIRVSDVTETTGGGAANTSVGLSRLGCDAAFCGVIGSDQWGERLLATLKSEKVETCCATVVEDETSSFSIVMRAGSGERVILYESGTNAHLHDATFDKDHARSVDWIYVNRLHDQSMMIVDDLLEVLAAKPSIGLTWNPGGTQIRAGMRDPQSAMLLPSVTLLLLNREEALEFTGAADVDAAIALLLSAGVKIACVTDGARGSVASDGKVSVHCSTLQNAEIVDTTGAGDAFGTGMTWALAQGYDLPTSLRTGTINSTSVLGAVGAQAGLLTDTEIRHRLSGSSLDVHVREIL